MSPPRVGCVARFPREFLETGRQAGQVGQRTDIAVEIHRRGRTVCLPQVGQRPAGGSPVWRGFLLPLVKIEETASRRTPIDPTLDQFVEPLPALGKW